ncbi:MAG TPA: DUF4411 family protein [Methanocorpusculum sp.]|nr:DUF4411 family protein [Methanocorpusculum sp.]
MNIYIIDTCSILDLAKYYNLKKFASLWKNLDSMLKEGRLHIINYVYNEIVHDELGFATEGDTDTATKWISERKNYVINLSDDVSIYTTVQKIIEKFPYSADIEKLPPDADPFLVAYALSCKKQQRLSIQELCYVIVTEERRNFEKKNIEQMKTQSGPFPSITKIRSICDFYKIQTMNCQELFLAEGWEFKSRDKTFLENLS